MISEELIAEPSKLYEPTVPKLLLGPDCEYRKIWARADPGRANSAAQQVRPATTWGRGNVFMVGRVSRLTDLGQYFPVDLLSQGFFVFFRVTNAEFLAGVMPADSWS